MNMWDERYAVEGYAYGTEPNDFIKSVRPKLKPNGRALCLAEGEGRNAVYLAQQGFEVVAMDFSPVGLEKAKALAAEKGVGARLITEVADLNEYAIADAVFDVIALIWCHMPQPMRTRVITGAVKGLKPGGALVLESYTPAQLQLKTGGPSQKGMLATLEELRPDLVPLRLEIAREITRDIIEGRYHKGLSAVVQVLGFRES